MGTVEVQPLVLTCGCGITDGGSGAREIGPQLRPIRTEFCVGIPHGERVVPKIDEHPYTMMEGLDRGNSGHIASYHKSSGTHDAPLKL